MPLANPRPGGARTVEVVKTEEKGSDVNLATYLLLDAFRRRCDSAVVISNDSDLAEPIWSGRYGYKPVTELERDACRLWRCSMEFRF